MQKEFLGYLFSLWRNSNCCNGGVTKTELHNGQQFCVKGFKIIHFSYLFIDIGHVETNHRNYTTYPCNKIKSDMSYAIIFNTFYFHESGTLNFLKKIKVTYFSEIKTIHALGGPILL